MKPPTKISARLAALASRLTGVDREEALEIAGTVQTLEATHRLLYRVWQWSHVQDPGIATCSLLQALTGVVIPSPPKQGHLHRDIDIIQCVDACDAFDLWDRIAELPRLNSAWREQEVALILARRKEKGVRVHS